MHTFREFLKDTRYSSNKEIVGLSIYYLHNYGEENDVDVSDIRALFKINEIMISELAIAAHCADLKDEELVTTSSKDPSWYQLTRAGFRVFGELAGDVDDYRARHGRFIDTDRVDEEDYKKLVSNINQCYWNGINDATLILTRKLFENLLIDILRAEFGGKGINLYFNTSRKQFHPFSTVCENFRDKLTDLGHYTKQLDEGLIDRVEEFKESGNSQAHSIRIGISNDEIDAMSDDATEVTDILWTLREEVRIANG